MWFRAAVAAAGVAPGGGSDGSCWRWRREQGRLKQVRHWLRALAVAQGIDNGARRLGSGSGGLGGKRYEVNSKSPSPGSFYKPLGSPTVIWHISL